MASTVSGANTSNTATTYHSSKKFYSNHSIKSDSTGMTEEDEDFKYCTNSSSFQTSTTNSSPINGKMESNVATNNQYEQQQQQQQEAQALLNHSFYSSSSISHKSHSNFIRRSMIQSPSMRNFNVDLYAGANVASAVSNKRETPTLGLTNSPSMRALESILNNKNGSGESNLNTSSPLAQQALIETITEEAFHDGEEFENDDDFEDPQPFAAPYTNKVNNKSELSVASFHTAHSVTSEFEEPFSATEKLLETEQSDDYNYERFDDAANALPSPGVAPVSKMGLFSPSVNTLHVNTKNTAPKPQSHIQHQSMLLDEDDDVSGKPKNKSLQIPPIDYTRKLSPKLEQKELPTEPEQEIPPQEDEAVVAATTAAKKSRRKSFVGFLKSNKKSASSSDLLSDVDVVQQSTKPKPVSRKSAPEVPIQSSRTKSRSKSLSNLDSLIKPSGKKEQKQEQEPKQKQEQSTEHQLPKSRSKIFSAFKRKSAYAVPEQTDAPVEPQPEKIESLPPKEKPLPITKEVEPVVEDETVLKENDLVKGHKKRNSILVPSPVFDQHQFEEDPDPALLKDLSFSTSMISSINHNYDIMDQSGIEDEEKGGFVMDEFNSSFNTINNFYKKDDIRSIAQQSPQRQSLAPLQHKSSFLPRDISVGSLRLDFDNYNLDDYSGPSFAKEMPQLHNNSPARKAELHKTSAKIQNLLGDSLFPKSLDVNEVASITTLERSRSMKSIRSVSAPSIRDQAKIDGMTVVRSPTPSRHEPTSNVLASPSSILKRRSIEYDDELQEFANMIDFGEDEYEEDIFGSKTPRKHNDDDNEDFNLSSNLEDLDYSEYLEEAMVPGLKAQSASPAVKSVKPLPSLPSNDSIMEQQEVAATVDEVLAMPPLIKVEEPTQQHVLEPPVKLGNPFDYPSHQIKEEFSDEEGQIPGEEFDFDGNAEEDEEDQEEEEEHEEEDDDLDNPFRATHVKEEEIDYDFDAEYSEVEEEEGGLLINHGEQHDEYQEEDRPSPEEEYREDGYDEDDFSVKIKQEEDFDEDFNNYEFVVPAPSEKSPTIHAYMPSAEELHDPSRPISMSVRGLHGPKFGETNKLMPSYTSSNSLYMTLPEDTSSHQYLQTSPSRLNLNAKIARNGGVAGANGDITTRMAKKVSFSSRILLFDTYHEEEYDRHPDIATCNQLTPMLAQQIREEMNMVKSQMQVHDASRCYTHFF